MCKTVLGPGDTGETSVWDGLLVLYRTHSSGTVKQEMNT